MISPELVRRIWDRDQRVWGPSPTEIADRRGWLTIADAMRPRAGELDTLTKEVS